MMVSFAATLKFNSQDRIILGTQTRFGCLCYTGTANEESNCGEKEKETQGIK